MAELVLFIKKIRNKLRHLFIGHLSFEHQDIQKELEQIKLLLGKMEARNLQGKTYKNIQDAEFKVFSQFGSDGIIQYLVNKVKIPTKKFVEFGVGDYSESNTRFLLMNNNWQGLIIDHEDSHINFLKSDRGKDIFYRHDIKPLQQHLTSENLNKTLIENGFGGDIGLLCIDIDSADYWFLNELKGVTPQILIVEYNSTFGSSKSVTTPYKENFDRTKEHFSNLYFGASLKAIVALAKKKGYVFVGSNSAGTDAFFVKKEDATSFKELTAKEGYAKSMFRESFDKNGNMTYESDHTERLRLIQNKKLVDLTDGKLKTIKEIYGL